MVYKRLEIIEYNLEKEYDYSYLVEGTSEEDVQDKIINFCKTWYDEMNEGDSSIENRFIDFYDIHITWEVYDCRKDKFCKELIDRHTV